MGLFDFGRKEKKRASVRKCQMLQMPQKNIQWRQILLPERGICTAKNAAAENWKTMK